MNDHLKTKAELIKELESLRKSIAKETPNERKREEEKLKASNQQLLAQTQELSRMATVVKDSNDAITIKDLNGNITAWNAGAVKTYGYSEKEALKMNVADLVPEGYKAEALNFIASLKKGEPVESLETKRLTKDGKTLDVWMVVTRLVDENGLLIGAATTERDITERKQAEEKLRASHEQLLAQTQELSRMATVVKDSNDAITIEDLEGNITAWNTGATKMYGYSEQEALNMNVADLVPEDYKTEALNFIISLKKGELVESLETKRLTKDGKTLDVWMVVTKLVDKNGELIGVATTERDITERNRVEDRLRDQAKKTEALNKELETFSYSVSHDLRAPLRHVSGYVELLSSRFQSVLTDKGQHYLDSIADSVCQMGSLIDDLLQFSRTGRAEMHESNLDMNRIVKEVSEQLQHDNPERNIEWTIARLPSVYGDQALLQLVWMNLLDNAVKFTRRKKKASIEIGFLEESDEFVFSVRDNGVGFDMKYAQKLFGVFQRLHAIEDFEGTGVGLANVHRIVSRHGGRTWAEAELDKGATFYFALAKNKEKNL